jgi:NAD-dependent dihydropyrimidine dehydrogenase PreA subunit
MAMFIRIDVNDSVVQKSPGVAQKLIESCPVKIFTPGTTEGAVSIVDDNVDECTLCDLCMQASPDGVKVVKLYEG